MNHQIIPNLELRFTFARSSGAGGQNVNKTSTKVFVHWDLDNSIILDSKQKLLLKGKLGDKINSSGELVVVSETERTQIQNRRIAVQKINQLVSRALLVRKKRQSTKPTWSSQLKRLEHKKKKSLLKTSRKIIND